MLYHVGRVTDVVCSQCYFQRLEPIVTVAVISALLYITGRNHNTAWHSSQRLQEENSV